MDFGPDGKLYLTIGDKWDVPARAQDLTNAGGKIFRLNKDGTIPSDNPTFNGAPGNLPGIWAYGLRNPFRASWDIPTNRFFIGDVGGNVQATAREELNLGVAGANYGWHLTEGVTNNPAYTDPIFDYGHTGITPNGGAIAGGLVYRGNQYPSEFQGAYFFGDYVGGWIRYLKFDQGGNVIDANPATSQIDAFPFSEAPIAPVAFEVGVDGMLYYVDYFTKQVQRLRYNSGNQAPVITTASATPTSGNNSPLTVAFTGNATDPNNNSLAYTWNFGDGNQANGKNVNHTYQNKGQYTATLQVSDGSLTTVSAPIKIVVGQVPVIQSTSPANNSTFRAGDTVTLSAVVTDDGPITGSNYNWNVRFIHNAHTHPEISNASGATLPFHIPVTGHDFSDSTGFEIELTITDSHGITATQINRIYPEKVDISIGTNFPGTLTYTLDGIPRPGNFVLDTAINFQHTISVPPVMSHNGSQYTFTRWSDNSTNPVLTFTVPTVNANLTAEYTLAGNSGLITQGLVLRLDAETGVTKTSTKVTAWSDASGLGNNLTSIGNPQLVTGALNGRSVIHFDGVGDQLKGVAQQAGGLPGGAADRSVFVVAKYDETGYGGFSYGSAATNRTFGTVVAPNGNLAVQGWGTTNDANSGVAGVGQGWLIQGTVLNANQLTHYKNGALIDARTRSYNTLVGTGSIIMVGAEIDGAPQLDMSVAEILVYDRALSPQERQQVESYLQNKYFHVNQSPVAVNDGGAAFTTAANASFTTGNVLSNDSDPDSGDILSVQSIDTTGTLGQVTSNNNGTFNYNPNGQFNTLLVGQTATDTFSYVVSDGNGGTATAAVTITINGTAVSGTPITPTSPIALFNGTSLAGLDPYIQGVGAGDPNQVFSVQGGLLRVSGNGMGTLMTANSYQNYVMVMDFKWGDETFAPRISKAKDAGLLFHASGAAGSWNGSLLPAIQSQIMEGGMGDIILLKGAAPLSITSKQEKLTCTFNNWNCRGGFRYKPTGTNRIFNTDVASVHASSWDPDWQDVQGFRSDIDYESPDGDWNQMVVIANGNTYQVYVNGQLVNAATNVTPTSGKVGVEVEFAEYFIKRWELLPLGTNVGPVITTTALAGAAVGQGYSQSVTAKSINAPVTYSLVSGTLPAGLSLNVNSGLISGTPTTAGTNSLVVRAQDAAGKFTTAPLSITVAASSVVSPKLQTGVVNVSTGTWTMVTLPQSYNDMVVVATLATTSSNAAVTTRIRNAASGNTFEIMLQHAGTLGGSAILTLPVHYTVVEAGVYTDAAGGVKLEAIKTLSTITDSKTGYVGQNLSGSLANSYTNPVVVGQVMTYNDPKWSTFWSRGTSSFDAVSSNNVWVGKHVGSDPVIARASETLGLIVIEQGSGSVDGFSYSAALGGNSIDGVFNSGDSYPLTLTNPTSVVASISGMKGSDGGWAVLFGTQPLSNRLYLAIDEDQAQDFERSHANEQVAYILFAPISSPGGQPLMSAVPTVPGMVQATDFSYPLDDESPLANPTGSNATTTVGTDESLEREESSSAISGIDQIDHSDEEWTSWKNFLRAGDVNNSGDVTAGDALEIVFELNQRRFSDAASGQLVDPRRAVPWPGLYLDRSGDNLVTAFDALLVINDLFNESFAAQLSAAGELDSTLGSIVESPAAKTQLDLESELTSDALTGLNTRVPRASTTNDLPANSANGLAISQATVPLPVEGAINEETPGVDELLADAGFLASLLQLPS